MNMGSQSGSDGRIVQTEDINDSPLASNLSNFNNVNFETAPARESSGK